MGNHEQQLLNHEPDISPQKRKHRPAPGTAASECAASRHQATDAPIEAMPGEMELIRAQLQTIERMLAGLFGKAYDRGPICLAARAEAAELIDKRFDEVVELWSSAVEQTFDEPYTLNRRTMANALVRFIAHLRDPEDLTTYVYLRRHCQEGMLARAKPSEFNIFHIALKQVALDLVRDAFKGKRMEVIRNTVVAAIDERRLMVAQFYIESRERALKASEEKYRNSIDRAPDPMYEIDPDTLEVLRANSAALELHRNLPYEQDLKLVGERLTALVPPEMQALLAKHIRTVVANGSDQALDLPLRGRYVDVNSALISSGDRQFVQMIVHDVTQRHEMLDTLLKAERLAAAGTFASGIAHEVNNPLASISSLVQSLLPGEKDLDRASALRTIVSQITRIATTLKDLVNFARPAPAERRRLDLNDMITETLRLVAYNRRFSGVRVEPSLDPDLKPAFADHNGIQQVLLNLLFNAADAFTCNEGGAIRVVTENQRGPHLDGAARVMMRVIDNGCGIAPENLERVFDPFFTTKPAGSGVGLGLSLCQSIVLTNYGTIRINSGAGDGTTVTICLPVYAAPEYPETPAPAK